VAGEETTIAIFAAAVALGGLCVVLLILVARRMLGRQGQIVTAMLTRYDDRLADFAQTLNDALNQTLPARITAAISGACRPSSRARRHAPARDRPRADRGRRRDRRRRQPQERADAR
jgi:hypothetical protein